MTILRIIIVLLIGVGTGSYYLYLNDIITAENIYLFLENYAYLAPLLYFLIHVIRPFTMLPSSILSVVAGLTFGSWIGFLICITGFLLGTSTAYIMGKVFQLKWLISRYPQSQQLIQVLKENSTDNILLGISLRFVPIFPSDLVSFAFGVCKIRYREFALGTLIGSFPGLFMFYYAGIQFQQQSYFNLILILIAFVILTLIFWKKKQYYKEKFGIK
ncbi:TVP38/TMEM64 family protein [Natranaerobius thermophilus]|uniref:TVP38/TMEM64 family membrane protein n=1 Tax=Natranaerobius thermophilus (strain ATCC BAA-1301 / DSM 18059 / JW/NM-WN-LF) TaxID=457570 RepID=B2A891_NATTJ|nr:VTT domain-containing protein [Natranaerobius thermophilus]ACB84457.1 SNARE associated Golgi protein [Natranaerobius thermophilus JW/NM-WN-LF]